MSSPNSLDFYDAELRAHHEHLRAAYGISPGDDVDLWDGIRTPGKIWFPSCTASSETWVFAEGRKRRSVSQPFDLAIVAHCVDVDPQNVPDSSRDPEGGLFRTGRDHDRKPRVGGADVLGRHSPQQLAV